MSFTLRDCQDYKQQRWFLEGQDATLRQSTPERRGGSWKEATGSMCRVLKPCSGSALPQPMGEAEIGILDTRSVQRFPPSAIFWAWLGHIVPERQVIIISIVIIIIIIKKVNCIDLFILLVFYIFAFGFALWQHESSLPPRSTEQPGELAWQPMERLRVITHVLPMELVDHLLPYS